LALRFGAPAPDLAFAPGLGAARDAEAGSSAGLARGVRFAFGFALLMGSPLELVTLASRGRPVKRTRAG
jgi:hypothetical protein